jgi:2'-5' RNA ligase
VAVPRLFVAVRPPPAVLARLAELPRPDEPGVRWVPPEHWHITLRFLGQAEVEPVVEAIDGASTALRGLAPTEAVLGPVVSRLGRQVICIPVKGLEALAAVVVDATAGLGVAADPRPFTGHLSLARLARRGACQLAGHPVQARFPVTGLELVSSVLDREGARHAVVGTVSFGD